MGIAASLATASILLLSACSSRSSPTEPESVRLGVPFTLHVGRSVSMEAEPVRVGFERVISDSRCPADVSCVWEGEASAALRFTVGRAMPAEVTLSTWRPRAADAYGYRIELLQVLPPRPRLEQKIDPASYEVELLVTK